MLAAWNRWSYLHSVTLSFFIKHWSLWLDLVILLKTVLDMLTMRGRA